MKTVFIVAATLAAATAASAQTASLRPISATPAQARPVMICDTSAATRDAFIRQYGEQRWVTTEDIRIAAGLGEAWTTPRCITDQELTRYRTEVRGAQAIADRR